MYMYVYTCTYLSIYLSLSISIYLSVSIYIYLYLYIYIHIDIYIYRYRCRYIDKDIHGLTRWAHLRRHAPLETLLVAARSPEGAPIKLEPALGHALWRVNKVL